MSHIPNSAMPHAVPSHEPEVSGKNETLRSRAARVADKAREHPKTAIAAGAAMAAGALAAAAIPLVRARRASTAGKGAGKAKKG